MRFLFVTISLALFSCNTKSAKQKKDTQIPLTDSINSTYTWSKIADSSAWRKNYNFQMFSIRDTLWVFHPDGNWFSADAHRWQKSSLPNAINNHAFLDYILWNDKVLGLGYFEGNIERFRFTPTIFETSNLKTWTRISEKSNLPARFFYHPFTFNNAIWIIGGEDQRNQYDDIWKSVDGVNWKPEKSNMPFGKRSGSQIVELNNKLYLLNNDVWSSSDAVNWELVTNEIIKGQELFGYHAVVFDQQIWLLGCNRNGQFSSEVLYSKDGKNWESQQAPWLPRGGIAATVHKNKIYMTGGKYGGTTNHPDFRYDNDIWVMEKK